MYNLGDDSELDRLSREAAGRYQHPGKPDWQQMEAELDKAMPETKKRRFRGYWLLPVLMAAGGAAYWLGSGNSGETSKQISQPVAIQENKTKEALHNPVTTVVAEQPAAGALSQKSSEQITTAPSQSVTASGGSTIPEKNKTAVLRGDKRNNLTGNRPIQTGIPSIPESSVKQQADNPPAIAAAAPTTAATKQTAPAITNKAGSPTSETKTNSTATATENNIQTNQLPSELPPGRTGLMIDPKPFGKGWSLGLLLGIDESTVKFNYNSAAGFNGGITVGYHFNKNWSLHTGAIYTHKNYKMKGTDFTPPKGSWASYYKLENVDGDCSMWEVPLLARYSFAQHGRDRFFVSTGLSSYFMTHENYSYFFYNNNQPVTRSMNYKSDDTHILSILHFSAGYENRLTEKLSLIVEPYAKIPLAGVGLGNIQLSSFGLNFSLQMRQPAHK